MSNHFPDITVCHNCIGDPVIKKRIIDLCEYAGCSFCKEKSISASIETVSKWVNSIYSQYYEPGSNEPIFSLGEDYGIEYRQTGEYPEEIIAEMLQTSEDISNNIVSHLNSLEAYECVTKGGTPMYQVDSCYVRISPSTDATLNWYNYSKLVMHSSRFMNQSAIAILDLIFKPLSSTVNHHAIHDIVPDSTESSVYRARIGFTKHERKRIVDDPQKELGIPPLANAKSGRMHSSGIPAFYGSFDRNTCIYEIRPPIGAFAISGEFRINEPVTVIDLTKINSVHDEISIFDEKYPEDEIRKSFFEQMAFEVSRPILPQHSELEYIPTQFLAEYLTTKLGKNIEGIIFSSSQSPDKGSNIVLLGKIAKNYSLALNDISKPIYEYFDDEYSCSEIRESHPTASCDNEFPIKFQKNSLKIHRIDAVTISQTIQNFASPL